ncbi:chromate transporter [Treponema sp.]|uniref:chromate transporter n=1 Tax=Treponema sp. TaxID=166 RepID=UPI003F11DFB6
MTLLHLFFIFMYIGFFAVGGGLVAASFMQNVLVNQYGLISAEKFYSMLAISESTPGPIGINIATYIGTELYGIPGGIIATAGEILPSIVTIILIAKFFSKFQEMPLVQSVFKTLRPVTSGLVLCVFVQVFSMSILNLSALKNGGMFLQIFDWPAVLIFALSMIVLFKTKLHPVVVVGMGAVLGILFY